MEEGGGKVSLKQVANETALGADYVRYIINGLIKKNFVSSSKKKRDWFILTARGKRRLATPENTKGEKRKAPRKKRKIVEKSAKIRSYEQNKIAFVHSLTEVQEEHELPIGKAMEKAAGLLKGFRSVLSSFKDKKK